MDPKEQPTKENIEMFLQDTFHNSRAAVSKQTPIRRCYPNSDYLRLYMQSLENHYMLPGFADAILNRRFEGCNGNGLKVAEKYANKPITVADTVDIACAYAEAYG